MAGAYVAKPADVPDPPDVPPGWTWPFPGPWPPGYDPELTLAVDAPENMSPMGVAPDVSTVLRDRVTYVTREPTSSLTLSAEWSNPGTSVQLMLSGGSGFLDEVELDYSDVGDDFWGTLESLAFDVDAGDVGKTVLLQVESTPFYGYPVAAEVEIQVVNAEDFCARGCVLFFTGCLDDCEGAVEESPTETYVGSYTAATCLEVDVNWDAGLTDAKFACASAGSTANTYRTLWRAVVPYICYHDRFVFYYGCQLQEVLCRIENGETGLEGTVSNLEEAIEDSQEQEDYFQGLADDHSTLADSNADESWAQATIAFNIYPSCLLNLLTLIGNNPAPVLTTGSGGTCRDLPGARPDWNATRCQQPEFWAIWVTTQVSFTGYIEGDSYIARTDGPTLYMTGRWTPSGKPYMSTPPSPCIPGHVYYSEGVSCTGVGDDADGGCHRHYTGEEYVYHCQVNEYEVTLKYSSAETTPEGETCWEYP